MLSSFLYIVVCLVGTHASRYQCPTPSLLQPCKCLESFFGDLDVLCESALVEDIQKPLAVIEKTKQPVAFLTLKNVGLWNLPSNLLLGHEVKIINIKECYTRTVDENAFVNVSSKLEWLLITENPLEEVPSHALQILSNLRYLILHDNMIQVLRAGAFKGLNSLQELSLRGNKIKFIDDYAFLGIGSRMRELLLCRNELTSVPGKQLSNLTSLRILEMADNKIASLVTEDFAALGGNNSLSLLNLANNTIRHLPAKVFKSLKELFSLNLSGNGIEFIHPLAFEGNEATFKIMKFRFNRLQEIPTQSLKNLSELHYIDLRENFVCKVRKDDFLPYGKNLETILLNNNTLKYVHPEAFIHLHNLRVLSLQSNQLIAAPFETYSPVVDTLEKFDIHDNPLHCDCNLAWLKNWFHGTGSSIVHMANETKCATPERYKNSLLAGIPLDELVCENSTSKFLEPCCNCFSNSNERLYSDWLLPQLGFVYLLATLGMSKLFK